MLFEANSMLAAEAKATKKHDVKAGDKTMENEREGLPSQPVIAADIHCALCSSLRVNANYAPASLREVTPARTLGGRQRSEPVMRLLTKRGRARSAYSLPPDPPR